jgi:hypothetical protein
MAAHAQADATSTLPDETQPIEIKIVSTEFKYTRTNSPRSQRPDLRSFRVYRRFSRRAKQRHRSYLDSHGTIHKFPDAHRARERDRRRHWY